MIQRTWPELETLALQAHRAGLNWPAFWTSVSADVRRLQARCPDSYRPLAHRLIALVVSGDEDGIEAAPAFDLLEGVAEHVGVSVTTAST